MKCLLLAAGYATRMYPLTMDKPKVLLDLNPKLTVLNFLLDKICSAEDITEVYIVTNNKFYNQFKTFLDKANYSKKIELINDQTNSEKERLGAIGDLYYGIKAADIDNCFMFLESDILFNFKLQDFISFSKSKNGSCITVYDIGDSEKAKSFGVVKMLNDKIIEFEEKPKNPNSTLVGTFGYIINKHHLNLIHEYVENKDHDENLGSLITFLVKNGVFGFKYEGMLFDTGSLNGLEFARKNFLD